MTTREKLEAAIEETKEILDSLNIEYGPIRDVDINFKNVKRWGRCRYNSWTQDYSIEISSQLFMDNVEWESLLNTLIHEFLHAGRDRMCHTGEWKRLAELVNRRYPQYNIKRCTSADEKGLADYRRSIQRESYHYKITCDMCGNVNYYKRRSKVVEMLLDRPKNSDCRCGRCGNRNFTIITL